MHRYKSKPDKVEVYFDEIITKNRCSDVCRRQIEITFKKKGNIQICCLPRIV